METRVALLAIIVKNPDAVGALNELLHRYGRHIIGRMGVPYPQRGVSAFAAIVVHQLFHTLASLWGQPETLLFGWHRIAKVEKKFSLR